MDEELCIDEDDYIISDVVSGGYYVGKFNKNYSSIDEALEAIIEDMNNNIWFPDVYFVNDHGNTDLLGVNPDTAEYEILKSWV